MPHTPAIAQTTATQTTVANKASASPTGKALATRTPVHDSLERRGLGRFRLSTAYAACTDARVARLIGQPRERAFSQIHTLRLLTLRVLDPLSPVTYEASPNRLTLVIAPDGFVTRAFCR